MDGVRCRAVLSRACRSLAVPAIIEAYIMHFVAVVKAAEHFERPYLPSAIRRMQII
jgi:hypothetical protein